MKKVVPIIILLIFFSFVLILISKYNEHSIDVEYVNELDEETEELVKVCVLNKDNQLVLIHVEKHNDDNIYEYVVKLYDHYRNNLPLNYKTPLQGNFEVLNVRKSNDVLILDLKMQYYEAGISEFLNALSWSYQDLGIDKIDATINGNKFTVEKNANINVVIESSAIYNNDKQIIYYGNENEIKPVTYYHNQDKLYFLMEKLKDKYPEIKYEFEVIDSFLVISINDENNSISKTVINLLLMSLNQLDEFSEIVIIINNEDVYHN